MDKLKGLLVQVYRSDLGDCTNGGISASRDKLILVGPDVPQIFEASDDAPAVRLVTKVRDSDYMVVEPVLPDEIDLACKPRERSKTWFMAGGNFIWTSDGRFPNSYPLPIHDRTEMR